MARQNYSLKSGMGTVSAEDYQAHPERYDVVEETQEQHDARLSGRYVGDFATAHPPTTIPNLATFNPADVPAPPAPVPVPVTTSAAVSQPVMVAASADAEQNTKDKDAGRSFAPATDAVLGMRPGARTGAKAATTAAAATTEHAKAQPHHVADKK